MAKTVLRVTDERLRRKVEETAQVGFRRGKGTRNAIFVLRTIIERATKKQKDLLCVLLISKKSLIWFFMRY